MSNSVSSMHCRPPGVSVHGIFRARILEWVAISFSRRSSPPRDQTRVCRIVDRRVYRLSHQGSIAKELESISSITYNGNESGKEYIYTCMCDQSLQLCPALCNPMDCSLSASSIHGVFQERILEWVAISFSRGSSRFRDQTQVSHIADRLHHLSHQEIPQVLSLGKEKTKVEAA